jgi:hypothetical protein
MKSTSRSNSWANQQTSVSGGLVCQFWMRYVRSAMCVCSYCSQRTTSAGTGQPQSLVRAVPKSHSFGGKSPNGQANGEREYACITMPAFTEESACATLLSFAVISV